MYGKMRLKRKRKKNKLVTILIVIIIAFFFSFFVINYFSNKVMPIFMSYAEAETRKFITLIINKAVTKQMGSTLVEENLYQTVTNSNGEIVAVDFNSVTVTKVSNMITSLVQLNLKAIEEGNVDILELPDNVFTEYDKDKLREGIIYEIPVGTIFNNAFLANIGPKIPVRMHLIGDVNTGIVTDIKNYGINNALIDIGVTIEVSAQINLPFISKKITIDNTVPIAMKIIQGQVPNMYLNGMTSTSPILGTNF